MRIVIRNRKGLPAAARKIVRLSGDKRIIAFYGSMGAGKTTIIRSVCKVLGATDITSSPSFTIVNEYRTITGELLYHIDFYRIKKKDELYDIGIEEYLTGDRWCFIEWPDLAGEIVPPGAVIVRITTGEGGQRILDIS